MDEAEQKQNLALLEDALAAYNRGDFSFVLDHAAPDIKAHAAAGLANSGTFEGREQFEQWARQWREAWRTNVFEIRNVTPVDDRRLLIDVRQRAEGAGSGIEVEMELTQLVEVRDGKIARFELYMTHEDAEAALERLRAESEPGRGE